MTHAGGGMVGFVAAAFTATLAVSAASGCAGSKSGGPQATTAAQSPASTATPTPEPPASMLTPELSASLLTPETSVSSSPSERIDSSLQPLIDQATADLATLLKVDSSTITVVSAKAVVWPDRSLGCPQPGMVYNQVTVDGALIELDAGGTTYSYHSGGSRSPFRCVKS